MEESRSFLFVPADSAKKIDRARGLRPDAVIYDLEDAVAPDKKTEARAQLKRELENGAHPSAAHFVRVNRFGSPFFDDDLEAAVGPQVHGIVLPKSGDAAEVAQVHEKMLQHETRKGMRHGGIKLVLMLESARGVTRAAELARCNSRTIAFLFGGEDFSADMGIVRTKAGDEIAMARSLVALAARSERLQAIDGPFTDFHDNTGLLEETRRIKQMGFSGKALIHPNQIEAVHVAFAPSQEEVAWAQQVVQTFETSGAGVAVVRGKMIDEPVVNQARKILRDSAR
jgi:citrate lyase subunit beta / citryl-CoA lyase